MAKTRKLKKVLDRVDKDWIVGEMREHKATMFMAWDRGSYGETSDPDIAEKFDTMEEALRYVKTDDDALDWMRWHPNATPMLMKSGCAVYLPESAKRRRSK